MVPGTPGPVESVEHALAFCEEHGMPVIFKAAYGGGGRGMRKVNKIEVGGGVVGWEGCRMGEDGRMGGWVVGGVVGW